MSDVKVQFILNGEQVSTTASVGESLLTVADFMSCHQTALMSCL